jgi:osmotically-inducible protein OsmY
MNDEPKIHPWARRSACKAGGLLGSALLFLLTGCTTYVEAPPPHRVYIPPPPSLPLAQPAPPPPSLPPPSVEVPVVVSETPVHPTIIIRTESDFYEPLSPYGRWVVVEPYGRCWVPARTGPDWRPYSNGHWQRTEAGWYWDSEEPWGWATYHYGRWDWDAEYGWIWMPQTKWAPAWVSFHQGGGYVGWAPLHPSARVTPDGVVDVRAARVAPREVVLVEDRNFLEPVRPTTVVVNNTTIINKTVNITNIKIVNNTVVNEGPRTAVIEQASGQKIRAVPARELRHKQEAVVLARQQANPQSSQRPVPAPARNESVSPERKAQEESDRRANEAKTNAQEQEQRKAKEAELKAAQAESERRAQEAKMKAQLEEQRKAKLQEQAAAQLEAERRVKEAQAKAQDEARKKAQEGAMRAAAKAQQPALGPMDAVATSARVKKVLETNPQYKGVTVVMSNGVARLSGLVKTADEKKQAGDLAKKVQGVREVLNNITIKE